MAMAGVWGAGDTCTLQIDHLGSERSLAVASCGFLLRLVRGQVTEGMSCSCSWGGTFQGAALQAGQSHPPPKPHNTVL